MSTYIGSVSRHLTFGSPYIKKFGSTIAKLLISASLLGYFLFRVDLHAAVNVISNSDPAKLLAAIALLCGSFVLGGIRWRCVLFSLGHRAPAGLLIRLFWIGGLAGQVLPNPFGDAVRVSYAARHGMGVGPALRSTFLERLVMIVTLLILVCLTAPVLRSLIGSDVQAYLSWALLGGAAACVAGGAIFDRLVPAPMRRFRVVAQLALLSVDIQRFLASAWSIPVYALAMLANLNLVFSAAILGSALALPLTMTDYLAIMPVATIAMVIPVSIGGWGLREGVLIALLGATGIPAEVALAFSLSIGLCLLASTLPAVLFLLVDRYTPNAARNAKVGG